jgi:hypothetical protein
MKWVKFTFIWLIRLFLVNPVKMSMFILVLTLLSVNLSTESRYTEKLYVGDNYIEIDDVTVICYRDNGRFYTRIVNRNEYEFKDGYFIYQEYYAYKILFWVVIALVVLVLVLYSIADSSDWDFEDTTQLTFMSFTRCELECGRYYYFIWDRLIKDSDRQLSLNYSYMPESISAFNLLSKYETVASKRLRKINEII